MSTAQKMLNFAEYSTTVLNRTNELDKKKKKPAQRISGTIPCYGFQILNSWLRLFDVHL